ALTTLIEERGVVPVHPPAPHSAARDMARLVLRGGLLPVMAATVLFGAGINAAFYFVAPFTRDLHIARAAPFFAAYASTTIALRVFGRRLPDRVGAHPIAVPSFGVFALGLAALCLLPQRGVLVAAGMACGAGHGSLFPVLNARAAGALGGGGPRTLARARPQDPRRGDGRHPRRARLALRAPGGADGGREHPQQERGGPGPEPRLR